MPARYRARPRPASQLERNRRLRFDTFLDVYWTQREAYVRAREDRTNGFEVEMLLYAQQNPPFVFKDYLIASTGQPR